jgi:hypothetical protein
MTIDLKSKTKQQKLMFLIEFASLFKKLREREKQVLCKLLEYQSEISYDILMDYNLKVKVRDDLSISEHNFNNIISSLKRKNIIINDKIAAPYCNFSSLQGKDLTISL